MDGENAPSALRFEYQLGFLDVETEPSASDSEYLQAARHRTEKLMFLGNTINTE